MLFQMRRIGMMANLSLSRALSATRLTPDQFQVLLMVEEQPGVSAVTLAQAIGLDAPTVGRLVNGLAQRGLLGRHRSRSDRRMVLLRVTAEAPPLIEEGRAAVAAADQEVVEQLRPTERRALERLFRYYSS